MPELAYLNGKFCPISEAMVSIEDRGFQFADGVYEVISFRGDQPLMLRDHFERLANSCREIRLDVDLEQLKLEDRIYEGVQRAGFDNTLVYLQLTRGRAPRNHTYPERWEPTVVMTFKPELIVSPEVRAKGISVMTVTDFRWSRCHVKSVALLPNVMAKNEALAKGYDDAIFVGSEGDVREASSSNVFLIRSGRMLTRPQDHTILPGITRKLVLACANELDLPIQEEPITREDLLAADEVFLSSTTLGILSVVRVDDQPIGDGRPGPLAARLSREMDNSGFKVAL